MLWHSEKRSSFPDGAVEAEPKGELCEVGKVGI